MIPFVVSLVFASTLTAASVRGRVAGFEGEPVAGVLLNLVDAKGEYLADTYTRADGSYRFADTPGAVRVLVWLEGVELETALQDAKPIDFDFKSAKYFTLRGHVHDPAGHVVPELELQCRSATDGFLASMQADGTGAFHVRLNRAVDHLLLDPSGWRQRVKGPFDADRDVTIDLDAQTFFELAGTITDEDHKPVAGAQVAVADAEYQNISFSTTDAEGRYHLWANRKVVNLYVTAGEFVRCLRTGAWDHGATIDVDWRGAGLVVLTGQVLDAAGKPVAGVVLVPVSTIGNHGHLPSPVGKSDKQGRFRVLLPATTPYLYGWAGDFEAYATGPWPKDAEVEARPLK